MNLVCMFCDNLDDIPETKELVSVNVMLCIPAKTREQMKARAVPCKVVGNICTGEVYTAPNDVTDIEFYINDLNRILTIDTPYLRVPMLIYGTSISNLKKIGEKVNGRFLIDINLNTTMTPISDDSDICVSDICSVTMYSRDRCVLPPDSILVAL